MNSKKPLIAFVICVALCFISAGIAALVQTGFGALTVLSGYFEPEKTGTESGLEDPVRIGYKLYIPRGADAAHPVPAVLVMHGYQNDRETSAAYGIELARRGIAALSVDLYGHGATTPGMRERGWGRAKLTNLEKPVSGPERFRLMMSFSILDFFNRKISAGVTDSSMGGKSAYRYLESLPFVDRSRIGITGHSMGTWASWSVGAAFPDHRAMVLQCGELFPSAYYDASRYRFNNVLLIQALYDEFDYFRDYRRNVPGLEKTPLRYREFMGQDAPVEWDRDYGSFADGSARRMELIRTNHRLTTHDGHALSAAMYWFRNALGAPAILADSDHIYMIKEVLVLVAMLAALASMLPLFLVLAELRFFSPLVQGLVGHPKLLPPKSRFTTVLIAILVSGFTFPFLGQLGHGLFPVPENIFRMTVGNGFIVWLSFLMVLSLVMLIVWYRRGEGKRLGYTLCDLGLAPPAEAPCQSLTGIVLRSALAACILTGTMYILVSVSTALYQLDFRFIWPFFKPFTAERFGQFFVYLPFYAAFFTVNAGVKLYGQLRLPEYPAGSEKKSSVLTQLSWWGYSVLVMLGGIFIIVLIEYIPFFLGFGPGADLLFSPLFGGPFMSVMILLIPQFAVFFFLSTWLYRKSGLVYTGSFVVAILASWVLSGGSAMF
jgi:dienelactone hydrolase